MGQLAELGHRQLGVAERVVQQSGRRLGVRRERLAGLLERDDGVHQPLLRAVVEVADDAAPLLVAGHDQPRTRRGEVRAGLEVRDRGRDQLGELGDARLGVRREVLDRRDAASTAPHRRPPTKIGPPTEDRMPVSRI